MGFKNSPARRTPPARLDEANLLDYALKSLSHRAHSEKELRTRLNRRSASHAATDAVVAKLREYGYVDDSRFAESFATSRLEGRGHGPQRVLRDLRSRSVSATNAEAAVDRVFAGADEAALAAQYLTRKFRGKNLPEFLADPKNLNAAFRRLRYAGFSASVSINVLRRHSTLAQELEDDPGGPPSEDE